MRHLPSLLKPALLCFAAGSALGLLACLSAGDLLDQCARLRDDPRTSDYPELERQCVALADYLPEAESNFADRFEVVQAVREGTRLVLTLVATDSDGAPVSGLEAGSFSVVLTRGDGGAASATVSHASTLDQDASGLTVPSVSFPAVVDYSGSIPDASLPDIEAGLGALFSSLGDPFEAALIHFSTEVEVAQGFSSDGAALAAAARSPTIERDLTSLFDALDQAIALTHARDARYRFVLLVSDGGDNDSETTEQEVLNAAAGAGLPFLAVGVGFADLGLMQRLAQRSGGFYTYVPSFDQLPGSFEDATALLRGTYQLVVEGSATTDSALRLEARIGDTPRTASVALD